MISQSDGCAETDTSLAVAEAGPRSKPIAKIATRQAIGLKFVIIRTIGPGSTDDPQKNDNTGFPREQWFYPSSLAIEYQKRVLDDDYICHQRKIPDGRLQKSRPGFSRTALLPSGWACN